MKRLFAILSSTVFLTLGQALFAGLNTNVFLDPPFNGTSIPVPQPPAGPVIEDPAFDIYCDRYKTSIDLRTSTNQIVSKITRIWVPKYRYWQCASDFWIWYDGIAQCCNPANTVIYTYEATLNTYPANCNGIPRIVTNPKTDLATPQYAGAGPNGWFGWWSMTDYTSPDGLPVGTRFNTFCSINPTTQGGLPWCGLTIYAGSSHWCTSKRVGTVYGLTEITEACTPISLTIDVLDIIHQMDPGATVCRDLSGNLVFFASDSGLWAGLPYGYLKVSGNWILFSPDSAFNVGALPGTPEEISRSFPDLLAQAAAFNTTTREELLGVIQAKTLELITSFGFQKLGAGIWGIALPQDISSACETLKFNVSEINIGFCPPPNCLDCPKPNSNGGMVLSGSLTGSCPSDGGIGTGGPGSTDNSLLLSWAVDTNKYGAPKLLADIPTLQGLFPTNLPMSGTLSLTNVYVPEGYAGVSVLLYALNRDTGAGAIRALNLAVRSNAPAVVTNLTASSSTTSGGNAQVVFTFDILSEEPSSITYRITQGEQTQTGFIHGPTNGAALTFITDRAGTVDLLLINPCGAETFSSANVSLSGPIPPIIELYSLYPNSTNLSPMLDEDSASTVQYVVRNPRPGEQAISYALYNKESGQVLQSGTYSNASLEILNNVRYTEMTAYALDATNSLRSASLTRPARVHIETPSLSLPPVLNNGVITAITNLTQQKGAFRSQLFSLQSTEGLNGFNSIVYPANGIIPVELDGNNVEPPAATGYWTNVFSNVSLPNDWFQTGNMSDPPVRPEGSKTVVTRFDVGDLAVGISTTNGLGTVAVSTVTSNAVLALERLVNGGWTTIKSTSGSTGTFTSVNFGFTQRIVGRKSHYNPTYYNLDKFLYLQVGQDPCSSQISVTVNPAVTNVSIIGDNFATNLTIAGLAPDANEMIQFPVFALSDGNYTFTATGDGVPLIRNLTVSGRFSYQIDLVGGGANFITGTNPTNNEPVYILDVTGAINPRLHLSSIEKPSLAFALGQPARVDRLNAQEVEINLSGIITTTEFQARLAVDNQPCPDIIIPLSVVVRRGSPNFDIPVSEPKTGDCLKLFNGTIPRWP
jgi:hypothetical protein